MSLRDWLKPAWEPKQTVLGKEFQILTILHAKKSLCTIRMVDKKVLRFLRVFVKIKTNTKAMFVFDVLDLTHVFKILIIYLPRQPTISEFSDSFRPCAGIGLYRGLLHSVKSKLHFFDLLQVCCTTSRTFDKCITNGSSLLDFAPN